MARPHTYIIAQITLKIKKGKKLNQKPAAPHLFVRILKHKELIKSTNFVRENNREVFHSGAKHNY